MKGILRLAGALLATAAIITTGCKHKEASWELNGTIDGVNDGKVVLEASNPGGYWYALDTLTINNKGEFTASQAAPHYPDIYRLNYNGKYIYFPIDSIEQLQLTTDSVNFATDYKLLGSAKAEMIAKVEGKLNQFLASHHVADLDTAVSLKRGLSDMVLSDPSSIVAYYIVNRSVDGHHLFRTDNRQELGIIGAVANAYFQLRPNDPRTQYLKEMWITNKKNLSNRQDTIMAPSIGLIDIKALDENGKQQSLADVASKNKIVILSFNNYQADYSQALNLALRDLYNKMHDSGLEIFQLGFSADEFQWRMAAGNQPWVTVFNGTTDQNLVNYNVGQLPALFVIKNGELLERISSVDDLKSIPSRY
ncbi:MAG: DUF4369 domain-containing protein [Bacteroides sp.]|nr:DUF4369 domain-containing protein [Bacteroides sp.]MCM1413488.1 DUF4369 domain-containing protein [Bacteroides sp.]MCM1471301.1 DUF4369 domain-containing protein [Bacteroides sp.]